MKKAASIIFLQIYQKLHKFLRRQSQNHPESGKKGFEFFLEIITYI